MDNVSTNGIMAVAQDAAPVTVNHCIFLTEDPI